MAPTQQQGQELGNITDITLYETAKVGIWTQQDGQRKVVMVRGLCNRQGHSPAVVFGDENLQLQTAALNDVAVIGVLDIPPSIDQIQRVFGDLLQGQGTRSTR